jgi:hypothetical protein
MTLVACVTLSRSAMARGGGQGARAGHVAENRDRACPAWCAVLRHDIGCDSCRCQTCLHSPISPGMSTQNRHRHRHRQGSGCFGCQGLRFGAGGRAGCARASAKGLRLRPIFCIRDWVSVDCSRATSSTRLGVEAGVVAARCCRMPRGWELVGERSECLHSGAGFIRDGFPRTLGQAESLRDLLNSGGHSLAAVVSYELSRQ